MSMGSMGLAVLVGLLMWYSQDCLGAALAAARVFAVGVMPALFPVMVLAGLPFSRKRSENAISTRQAVGQALLFAMAAGSPAGARRVRSLCAQGQLEGETAARLYIAAGMVSPLFFLGSLALWTGSETAGPLMLAAHWLSGGLTGGLCWLLRRGRQSRCQGCSTKTVYPNTVTNTPQIPSTPGPSLAAALPGAIAGAGQSLLSVCGAMMLFSIGAALLRNLLAALFPAWTAANPGALAILHGLLEIGGGANAVCQAFADQGDRLYALLSGLCGFGGLSIWIQNLAFTGDSIRPGTLLLYRSVHGAAGYAIARLLFFLWPQTAQTSAALTAPLSQGLQLAPVLPLAMLLVLGTLAAYLQKSKTCSPHN